MTLLVPPEVGTPAILTASVGEPALTPTSRRDVPEDASHLLALLPTVAPPNVTELRDLGARLRSNFEATTRSLEGDLRAALAAAPPLSAKLRSSFEETARSLEGDIRAVLITVPPLLSEQAARLRPLFNEASLAARASADIAARSAVSAGGAAAAAVGGWVADRRRRETDAASPPQPSDRIASCVQVTTNKGSAALLYCSV